MNVKVDKAVAIKGQTGPCTHMGLLDLMKCIEPCATLTQYV